MIVFLFALLMSVFIFQFICLCLSECHHNYP